VVYAKLRLPGYTLDWDELPRLVTGKTKMIIINTPHNPTGSVLGPADLHKLDELADAHDLIVLSDEVYEHLIFDGIRHESICHYPRLSRRSIVVFSFGKTFHATGWKMGYALAPSALMAEFRKVHQFVVFAANTPVQYAVAEYLENQENYIHLPAFYQEKRDRLVELLAGSRFRIIPSYGTYFQLVDYSEISDLNEMNFAVWMTKTHGVATIPLSPFYHDGLNNNTLRLCFAKKEETLVKSAEILCKI
jgi:methionine aminotransferase